MVDTGHATINCRGEITGADSAFCRLMKSDPKTLRGKLVNDVTAPADRAECGAAIAKLLKTGAPFCIVKRLMSADGSLVWVRNTVSIMVSAGDATVIVATIEPVAEHGEDRTPALLLDAARSLVIGRSRRASICNPALFSEPSWDAILAAYVAEAEGKAVDVTSLATALGCSKAVVSRWVKTLEQYDVLEVETRNPTPDSEKAFRLTAGTHQKLEAYLYETVGNGPRLSLVRDLAA